MKGTIVNSLAIVVAGIVGYIIKKAIPKKLEQPVIHVIGLAVILIALLGFLTTTVTIENGQLKTGGEILMLVSLVIGTALGELIRIDDHINNFGQFVEKKANIDGFAKSFVTASLLFCVGAMAVFGSLQDGISGDSSVLFVKSIIDGITALILSATLGIGVCFSGISVFVYQGSISLLAGHLSPFVTAELMNGLCMVGYATMITIGTNMMGFTKIKTANMMPAMAIPIIYFTIF